MDMDKIATPSNSKDKPLLLLQMLCPFVIVL